jgi:hypothetical protein
LSKIDDLTPINSSYTGVAKLNAHLAKIEAAFENTVSRDGSTPNTMTAPLDMNSQWIVNLADPNLDHHAATKAYVDAILVASSTSSGGGGSSASNSSFVYAADYINILDQTSDQSTGMAQALLAATGKTLILPPTTIVCKNLTLPPNTDIQGTTMRLSVLKLPNNANTYVIASQGYVNNTTVVDFGSKYSSFTVDGNKANQTVAVAPFILRTYRSVCSQVTVKKSKGRGLLLTAKSANGTAITNNMAENIFINGCCFQENDQEGWYGEDMNNQLADWVIMGCNFYDNGGTSYYNCKSERSAGGKYIGNQTYGSGQGDCRFQSAGRLIIADNHFDLSDTSAASGTIVGCVIVTGGHAHVVVSGNLFHNNKASSAVSHVALEVQGGGTTIVSCTGNTFYATAMTHTSIYHTGSGYTLDSGNTYYGMTRTTPSATVRRALETDSSGVVDFNATLESTADIRQTLAGGGFITHLIKGEGTTQTQTAKYFDGVEGPIELLTHHRGTIASPADVVTNDEAGRRAWFMRAGGVEKEVARDSVIMQEGTPSASAVGCERICYLAPMGSGTVSAVLSFSHASGLKLFGTQVIDASRGIRTRSYTSAELNALANAVNTTDKVAGKQVWNSTVSKPVWAAGSTAAALWVDGSGTTINTPV